MKKQIKTAQANMPVAPKHRSFRRFVKSMFTSFLKRQNFQAAVLEKLQDLGHSIEIMAQEMARQAKRRK